MQNTNPPGAQSPPPISLQGDLDIRSAQNLKRQVEDAIAGSGDIDIESTQLCSADVAILQILISAAASLAGSGRRLNFRDGHSEGLRRSIDTAGLAGAFRDIPNQASPQG